MPSLDLPPSSSSDSMQLMNEYFREVIRKATKEKNDYESNNPWSSRTLPLLPLDTSSE